MPLNAALYRALSKAFPSGVKIAKEGEPMQYKIKKDLITQRPRIVIEEGGHGEEYRICCPFCGDTRYRLWISHKWNSEDSINKIKFGIGLANCFNDGCDLNREAPEHVRRAKQEQLRDLTNPMLRHTVSLPPQVAVNRPQTKPELPEKLIPLTQLDSEHHAIKYLRDARGFDIERLVELYQVAYCPTDPHPLVDDRIIIPIRQGAELIGWQARYIGKPSSQIPKYFTMPGMRKTQVLYNYDRAKQYPVGVIMEGVTDVWTLGAQGVNVFGSSVHDTQRKLIHAAWGETGLIYLADGDVIETEQKKSLHERVVNSLKPLCKWGVLEIVLPANTDPGDYTAEDLWAYILQQAANLNYKQPIFDETALTYSCHRRAKCMGINMT